MPLSQGHSGADDDARSKVSLAVCSSYPWLWSLAGINGGLALVDCSKS